jgi:hypothetical protein
MRARQTASDPIARLVDYQRTRSGLESQVEQPLARR